MRRANHCSAAPLVAKHGSSNTIRVGALLACYSKGIEQYSVHTRVIGAAAPL